MDTYVAVSADKTVDGWILRTYDASQDILAGPFPTFKEAQKNARGSNLCIMESSGNIRSAKRMSLKNMPAGSLFRINEAWYRMLSRDGAQCLVERVGEKSTHKLPSSAAITEISVLSLS